MKVGASFSFFLLYPLYFDLLITLLVLFSFWLEPGLELLHLLENGGLAGSSHRAAILNALLKIPDLHNIFLKLYPKGELRCSKEDIKSMKLKSKKWKGEKRKTRRTHLGEAAGDLPR